MCLQIKRDESTEETCIFQAINSCTEHTKVCGSGYVVKFVAQQYLQ